MRALTVGCMVAVAILTCGLGYAQELEWVTWADEAGGNGHEYAIVGTEASWDEQDAVAVAQRAWLTDIADEAENDFVEAFIEADYSADAPSMRYYWIGLVQDPAGEEPGGGWGWSSGAPLNFTNWDVQEPNDYRGEDVVAMHSTSGSWIDGSASSTMRAVLEREPTPPDDTPPDLTLDTPEPDELAPPDGRTVSVAVTGSATDDETGVAQARLVLDDEYDLLDGEFDVTALLDEDANFATTLELAATCNVGDADGRTYMITLHAVDGAGNVATPVSQTVVVSPDTIAPTVTLDAPVPATLAPPVGLTRSVLASVSVTGRAVDDGTGVAQAWLVIDDEYDLLDGKFDVTALLDGNGDFATTLDLAASCNAGDADGRTYMITLHAVDGAGNAATPTSVTVLMPPQGGDICVPVVTLDPPSPDILWPPNRRMVKVIISGSVVDGGELGAAWLVVDDEYDRLDGSRDVLGLLDDNGRFEITIELQAYRKWRDRDGRLYTISLHATDVEGNKADPVSVAVVCPRRHPDKTSPTLTLDSATPNVLWPPNGRKIRVKVAGSATDDGSGVRRVWLLIKDEYYWRVRRYNITRALDGDGNFEVTVKLQASRRGRDRNGRKYRLFLVGSDVAGNWGRSNTLVVRVPHNQ